MIRSLWGLMPQKVILDVDTGADDAVAMLLAGHHMALELVAVTVTHGNAPLATTLENTLRLLAAGGLEHVPVYAGAVEPLVGPPAPKMPTQLAALPLSPAEKRPEAMHAALFLVEYYMGPQGADTLYLPVGPQTNLALALRLEPRLAGRIPGIITMGGAYIEGNTTPSAEFNILADPEAASVVFAAGIPITMIGLEVTARAEVRPEDSDSIRTLDTPWARLAADLIDREIRWFQERRGTRGGQIFDACAVAAAIDPTLVTTRPMWVNIELHGAFTRGRTVADISGFQRQPPNTAVGVDIDRERFLRILHDGLR